MSLPLKLDLISQEFIHPSFGHHPHAQLLPVWATLLCVQWGFFLLQAVNFAFCPCPAHPWELPASAFSVTPAKLGNQRLQLVPVSALPPPGEHTPLLQPALLTHVHLSANFVIFCWTYSFSLSTPLLCEGLKTGHGISHMASQVLRRGK